MCAQRTALCLPIQGDESSPCGDSVNHALRALLNMRLPSGLRVLAFRGAAISISDIRPADSWM